MLKKITSKLKKKLTITGGDYKKYGCPTCNTINPTTKDYEKEITSKKIICKKCHETFYIIGEKLENSNILIDEHPNKNQAIPYKIEDIRPENRNEDYCIFKEGNNQELIFKVYSTEAANRIIKMFEKDKNLSNNTYPFNPTIVYKEEKNFEILLKIIYQDLYKALALKNETIKNNNKINYNIITSSSNLELNFKNKWQKCCMFKNVFLLSNVEYIQSCISNLKWTSDIYNITSMNNYRKNIIELFETFGMYVQINKELEKDNIENAAKCILHYTSNINTNFSKQKYKENAITNNYINEFRNHLQNDLLKLLNNYYDYENGELKSLELENIDFNTVKNINITNSIDKLDLKINYEKTIKPLLYKLINLKIIRKLTRYVNEPSILLTEEEQKTNNIMMIYLLYGFKLQMEVELNKDNYKDAYFAIEYLIERLSSPLYKNYLNQISDENQVRTINCLKTNLQTIYNRFSNNIEEEYFEEEKPTKHNRKKRTLIR